METSFSAVSPAAVGSPDLSPVETGSPPAAPAAPTAAASYDEKVDFNRSLMSGRTTGTQIRVQTGIVRRSLSFTQDVYHRMRTLQTNDYVVRADAAIYPTFAESAIGGRIGLIGGFEAAYAGTAHDANFDHDYSVTYSEVFGGLRARYPLRESLFGFNVAVGHLSAGLDDAGTSGTPDVGYTDVRSSFDFAFAIERFRATVGAGFRVPLSYGEISEQEWFPRVGGYALEGSLSGSYLLTKALSLDLSTSWRRFVLEMNSAPEDSEGGISETAGGAVDSYLGAYLGISLAL